MTSATRILQTIEQGDPSAAEQLLPLVYDELRRLAAAKLANEKPGQTLQATALVHEAYIRLVDAEKAQKWNSRGHFFAAAAEAMRRILVDAAREKRSLRRGGEFSRHDLSDVEIAVHGRSIDALDLDEAMGRLAEKDQRAVEIVKLRFFAGLTVNQAAEVLGLSPRSADELWAYARAWLYRDLKH